MAAEELKTYLDTRRAGWPYEDSYHVEHLTDHRFVAKAGGELAGLSYAELSGDGLTARMKMNLNEKFAEFGIGLRYGSSQVMDTAAEVLAYGTAVKIIGKK